MAEFLPTYKPGQAVTSTASATITGGKLVAVSGSGTVATAGAASTAVLGVAAFDAVTNDKVTVYCGGVVEVTASGAITAGSPVIAGAAGSVVASATPPAGQQVGIALTTAADTALVRVQLQR
jgi:hypothetical protein